MTGGENRTVLVEGGFVVEMMKSTFFDVESMLVFFKAVDIESITILSSMVYFSSAYAFLKMNGLRAVAR